MPQHYKLVDGTLEIDGVRMHQTARKAPLEDARDKIHLLHPRFGMKALDVCTGLGYSAIELAHRGCVVTTIEKDARVLELAKENPDSHKLFNNSRIEIIKADALEMLPELASECFDLIHHDPPRFSHAGELYSGAFYRELYRVLRKRGRLFHYTGLPSAKSGKNIPRGVKERLAQAGFVRIQWHEDLQGFSAEKN